MLSWCHGGDFLDTREGASAALPVRDVVRHAPTVSAPFEVAATASAAELSPVWQPP